MEMKIESLKREFGQLSLLLKDAEIGGGFYKSIQVEKQKIKQELLRLVSMAYKPGMLEKRLPDSSRGSI